MSEQGNLNINRRDLLQLGVPAEVADALSMGVQSAIPALGTTYAGAQTSTADVVYISSTASNNAGLVLRNGNNYLRRQIVINAGVSTLTVYPYTGIGSINNLSSVTLASGTMAMFVGLTSSQHWKE